MNRPWALYVIAMLSTLAQTTKTTVHAAGDLNRTSAATPARGKSHFV